MDVLDCGLRLQHLMPMSLSKPFALLEMQAVMRGVGRREGLGSPCGGRGGAVAGDEQLPVALRLSQHRLHCLARQDGRAVDRQQDGKAGHRAAKAASRRACRAATTAASSSALP